MYLSTLLAVACSGPNYHYSVIFSFHVANIYTLQFSTLHDGFSEIFTAFNYFAETPLLTATQKKLAPHQREAGEAADRSGASGER